MKGYHCIHMSPSLVHALSHINLFELLTNYFFKIYFNIILQSESVSTKRSLLFQILLWQLFPFCSISHCLFVLHGLPMTSSNGGNLYDSVRQSTWRYWGRTWKSSRCPNNQFPEYCFLLITLLLEEAPMSNGFIS